MKNKKVLHLINEGCRKINELTKCQVIFLDNQNNCINEDYIQNMTPPYSDNTISYLTKLFENEIIQTEPLVMKSKEEIYYVALNLIFSDIYYGKYIVGPFADKKYSKKDINEFYKNNSTVYDIDLLVNYYKNIKIFSFEAISSYASLCKNMIEEWFVNNNRNFYSTITDELQIIRNNDIIQQKEYQHKGYNTDKIMLECVKNGYPGEIKRFLKDYWNYSGRRELLEGTLRDRKNFTISYIAMLIQAAIDGGLDYEIASQLNIKYISLSEKKNFSSELEQLEIDILYDLSQRVKKIKREGNTKFVRDCKDFILENIFKELKISDIAKYFNIDSKYLSRRFKKETKETIKNYINRKKVEEAKRIMQSSNMSIIDIAFNLSFYDQSHFTKIFKEFAGTTPRQYYKKIKSK